MWGCALSAVQAARARRLLMQILFSFFHSPGVCTVMPIKRQVQIQPKLSSIQAVLECMVLGQPARFSNYRERRLRGRQKGRTTHAYIQRWRAKSRLGMGCAVYTLIYTCTRTCMGAHTHFQRSMGTHTHVHTCTLSHKYSHAPSDTQTDAHTHARACTRRRTQQCCIDFQQFFDEMSYSDSLPRCYFA